MPENTRMETVQRAVYLLGLAEKYVDEEKLAIYDDAECDGGCFIDDCRTSAFMLKDLIKKEGW